MSKLRILHLSDVHFGCEDLTGEQERITYAIPKALKENKVKVDLIVFTGDLAFSGAAIQFQQGQEWLNKIQSIVGGKVVICPGNHDLNRDEADQNALRLAYPSEESFNLSKTQIYSDQKQFSNFKKWSTEVAENHDHYINIWNDNLGVGHDQLTLSGISTAIIGINTALLAYGDDDQNKLCVDITAINSALSKYDPDNQLIISIGHHPLQGWLANWNADRTRTLLGQETGVHLYLHGHLHETETTTIGSSTGQNLCEIAAGASYQGSKWDQTFAVLEIDTSNDKVRPIVYCYSNDSGRWDINNTISRPITTPLPDVDYTPLKEEGTDVKK